MTRPRHMAPPRPLRRLIAVGALMVALFAGCFTGMACTPTDGNCGGEVDCSEVRP